MVPTGRVYAYDFQKNDVPGVKPYEEPAYWRDVGTIDAYFDAHMDLRSVSPLFNLYNDKWPILTQVPSQPPAKSRVISRSKARR